MTDQKRFVPKYRKHHVPDPTSFPATFHFSKPQEEIEEDVPISDIRTHVCMKLNVGRLDPGQLRGRVVDGKGRPWTVEDLIAVAKKDDDGQPVQLKIAELDGQETECAFHGGVFQPMTAPFEREDGTIVFGGSFLKLKVEQVDAMTKSFSPEKAEKFKAAVAKAMAEIMKGVEVPSRTVVAPVCRGCREQLAQSFVRLRFLHREAAKEELVETDQRLQVKDDIAGIAEGLGLKKRDQPFAGGRPSYGRRDNNRHRRFDRRDDRPPKPRRDWHGADLEVPTADALDKAGYTDLESAVAAAKNGKLVEQNIAHERSIGPIRTALERAQAGRHTIGDNSSSESIATPSGNGSAAKPKPTPKPKKTPTIKVDGRGGSKAKSVVSVGLDGLRA